MFRGPPLSQVEKITINKLWHRKHSICNIVKFMEKSTYLISKFQRDPESTKWQKKHGVVKNVGKGPLSHTKNGIYHQILSKRNQEHPETPCDDLLGAASLVGK